MYTLTCCRLGKYMINRQSKGQFVKKFSTLSQVAKFILDSNKSLFYPNYLKEFTSRERTIISNKCRSMVNKEVRRSTQEIEEEGFLNLQVE